LFPRKGKQRKTQERETQGPLHRKVRGNDEVSVLEVRKMEDKWDGRMGKEEIEAYRGIKQL
jgi:hypothetical protein